MAAYYNEIDPYAARWIENLIAKGIIPKGVVDTRSIVDVRPDDVRGFDQVHWFAGLGGWAYAARLAGWADDKPLWTGSCPCQPFSQAGLQSGTDDPRHLWPYYLRLASALRPPVLCGEQVASPLGYAWLDGVGSDLEGERYAFRALDIPACAVNAPHIRHRLWWFAVRLDHGDDAGLEGQLRDGDDATGRSLADRPAAEAGLGDSGSFWSDSEWIVGWDGKARRIGSRVPLMAYGVPARVPRLRAIGNAIVPPLGAEILRALNHET